METQEKPIYSQDDIANIFLWGLWRSIDTDYKMKYAKDCWNHFENAIKSASYSSNLKQFLNKIQNRLPIDLKAEFLEDFQLILSSGQDDEILDWLRYETTYMYYIVRIKNNELKESQKQSK